ncbi:MAG: shikimate kinase [Firmicutes bacterium HGW-Firmicutes-1]|jgi:shikimate kinase|nr:MAG: shikimate kinase [Firmicutes bacterium HGW-Firmicutes-1]
MNIILIGMPGAGKSTVGVVLAKALGFQFIDTDLIIQEREQELLHMIIQEKGMEAFLALEEKAILTLTGDNKVIATGGSVIYKEAGMNHLKKLGIVVYLNTHYKILEKRIRNMETRGIAMGKNNTLKDIYWERKALYERYADLTVTCKGKTVEKIVKLIKKQLQ